MTYAALPPNGTDEDRLKYVQGYEVGRRFPDDPLQDKNGPWYRGGQDDGMKALAPRYVRVQRAGVPARVPSDVAEYWRGYEFGKAKYKLDDVWGLNPDSDLKLGLLDGGLVVQPRLQRPATVPQSNPGDKPIIERKADGTVIVNPPPPLKPGEKPSPVVGQTPVPRQAPPVRFPLPPLPAAPNERYLELCVFIAGRPVLLDTVYNLDRLGQQGGLLGLLDVLAGALTSYQILGDVPGNSRLGFRLSGPRGPIARFVNGLRAEDVIGTPQEYGLSAWVGTRTRRGILGGNQGGIRLLSSRELRALGFNPLAL